MGKRLTAIVTKTGDAGSTGLADGSRVSKDSARISAIGDIDELNSFVGLLLCEDLPLEITQNLNQIQQELFNFGSELAVPGAVFILESAVNTLDDWGMALNKNLPPLQEFILPAGDRSVCLAHVCRSVARRAEREVVGVSKETALNPMMLQYINRLSDCFFMVARTLSLDKGGKEVYWQSKRLAASQNDDVN